MPNCGICTTSPHPKDRNSRNLPAYKAWHSSAEQLPTARQRHRRRPQHLRRLPLNHTFQAWNELHAGIRELQQDLDHDTSSLRHQQPDLYLQPITRPVPTLDDAKEADASYRRLREKLERSHGPRRCQTHPSLRDPRLRCPDRYHPAAPRSHPPGRHRTRRARGPSSSNTPRSNRPRTDIDAYLHDTQRSFRSLTNLKDVAERFKPQGIELKDIGSYAKWRERALGLAGAGKDILADRQHYRIHLKLNPEITARIHATIQEFTCRHAQRGCFNKATRAATSRPEGTDHPR